jgi:hypothetical protein
VQVRRKGLKTWEVVDKYVPALGVLPPCQHYWISRGSLPDICASLEMGSYNRKLSELSDSVYCLAGTRG